MARRKGRKQQQQQQPRKQVQQKRKELSSEEDSSESEEEDVPQPSKNERKKGGASFQVAKNKQQQAKEKDSSSEESSSSGSSSEDDDKDEDLGDTPVFSDKNAKWLKPKDKLLDSDDDDEDEEDDEQQEDDSDDEMLDIEREAQILDEEDEEERIEAQEEMERTVREHTAIYHLPTPQELAKDVDRVVPPSEIKSHIDSILEVLADFKTRREPGRARKEYIDQLGNFIAELYGYLPELVEYFLTMFGPAETLEFVEQSDKPRPMVIRTNTLKTRRKDLAAALIKRGVTLDPLANWSKVGLKIIESPVPIGATPEYLSGHYMLQSAASMCPVMALDPQPKEKVLDVSAAPGGKTSYIAQLMRNTGMIMANDLKAERQKATVANMHRLGVKNVIASKCDGRKLGTLFKNRFDRILLDAPCSGLGVISRDPSVKVQRTIADVNQCAHLQKELLLAAIDALKFKGTSGGVMVYSTCSVSVAENEEVVNYALAKRDIKIIETGLDFGEPGFTRYQQKRFHPSVALTRRFYPHVHNMDGFFVAKIQKLSDNRPGETKENEKAEEETEEVSESEEQKEDTTSSKEAGSKEKSKPKKRKRAEEEPKKEKKLKSSNVSIPPTKQKQGKKKKQNNAKTSKPRRMAAATDA